MSKCPVYTTIRVRASAPHVIARAGLKLSRSGDPSEALNLYLCTGCGSCEATCPVNNPLPEAIRASRARLGKPDFEEAKPLYMAGRGDKMLIVSPKRLDESTAEVLAGLGYSVYWLDSTWYTLAYWSGLNPRINIQGFSIVISEDLDAPINGASSPLELLEKTGISVRRRLDKYILHLPCKAGNIGDVVDALGQPKAVVRTCSGAGGGMLHYMEKYSVKMASLVAGGCTMPIVTLCRWSQMAFRKAGLEAYTLLDLVA